MPIKESVLWCACPTGRAENRQQLGSFHSLEMSKIELYATILYILTAYFNPSNAIRFRPLPKFPALFIFGDSTVDTGNNNYIDTIFRANFHPYGQHYPGHTPTGRFSDGKLIPDFLASILRIKKVVPPFLKPNLSDHELVTGVSFASAGSGYDNTTNTVYQVTPVPKQIELFRYYSARLKRIVGEPNAKKIIGGALVIISAGTNDISNLRMDLNDTEYQDRLLYSLRTVTQQLYDLGCRSMLVAGVPPIESYNQKLAAMLPQLQAKLSGSKMVYANIYKPLIDMVSHPKKYGFMETNRGCCGTGLLEMGPLCNPTTPTCGKASHFIFWDAVHPSQATYRYLTKYIEKRVLPKFL